MNILFLGDISGRPGRQIIKKLLPEIITKHSIDFVIANAENAAGGRGITSDVLNELQSSGIDFFTTGEHVWDQPRFVEKMDDENIPLARPINYEGDAQIPGKGYELIDLVKEKILVIALTGQTFMRNFVRSPFWVFDELWEDLKSRGVVTDDKKENPITVIDYHAEATAEKLALGWYVKDRVHAFLGTHTHVATADNRLLNGMAYVTDVGMCGPYEASLWVDFENVINNFRFPTKKKFKMKKGGERILNAVKIEIEDKIVKSITRLDRTLQA